MAISTYAVAVGGNRRGRHGAPRDEVRAALALLGGRASPILDTPPLGPSIRRFANAVAIVESDERPRALLARLKAIERAFGRRAGRRWGTRVIDLDIVLWSGGRIESRVLTVPHAAFRTRAFVLSPLVAVAPGWRDPVTGLRVRHLHARLTRARPINRPRWTW
ncbi:2-amino-4-hydroxy-6-hydroxymethyldihydropteridine diphosphokinase [Sphingomonas adhaesiva]|uniref:2-amino-4-hydroxy-6- hydroxymethyldihydropteridine diphosphokinase n=1 Tax=Sphingomonas adhaesiva TaxID=28212 RepID=UPI002FFCF1FB